MNNSSNTQQSDDTVKTVKRLTSSVAENLIVSVLTVAVVTATSIIWKYLGADVVQNVLIVVLLVFCLGLLVLWKRAGGVDGKGRQVEGLYHVAIEPFSTLVENVEHVLMDCEKDTTATPTYLVHWVPTFGLSRGLDRRASTVRAEQSPVYLELKESLAGTRGKILCFDGPGIYKFLEYSDILFDDPRIISDYLTETVDLLSDTSISVGFLKWGLFPYTFLSVGDEYALFDFTTMEDIRAENGYVRAARRGTLRITTTDYDEVHRVRQSMFDTLWASSDNGAANLDPELREETIRYLTKVASVLRDTGRLVQPADAERRWWEYETTHAG